MLVAPLISYAPHTEYAFASFLLFFVLFWFMKQKQKQEGKQK
jgi:preprotein translocase subunit YajC